MNPVDPELAQAVEAIRSSAQGPNAVDLVTRVVDRGGGSQLVEALVADQTQSGGDKVAAVQKTMRQLESLAAASRPLACVLMANLMLFANDLRMHDVAEAIDLWIIHCTSDELTPHLKTIAESRTDPYWRKHFEQLIELRRNGKGTDIG